jgi:hypothetical protein
MARARGALSGCARAGAGAWGYAYLFLLFALLYRLTASRDYTFDSLSYALQIERFTRTGEYSWLFHQHHLLFNALGLGAFRAFRAAGLQVGTLDALQGMNALLGAAGVVLFAWIAGHVCRHRGAGLLAGAGLGLSYGYWTCSTDGRVNIAGVVVLAGVLGAMAVLLGARSMESRASYLRWAGVLGGLHLLAVLLHQSHALLAPAAVLALWLSPGRPRWQGIGVYLATTLGLGTLAYTVASVLANGSSEPSRVLAWAMTYAHRGHWWSLDLGRNLLLDARALRHVFVAQPALAGGDAPAGGDLLFLLAGSLAAGGAVVAVAWGAIRYLARVGESDPRGRGIRRSRYWFTPRRPASFDAPVGSLWTRAGYRIGRWAHAALRDFEAMTGIPGPAQAGALMASAGGLRRLYAVLGVWGFAYAAFFTFWNPGYFAFWVPILIPAWLLAALFLASTPGRRLWRWAGAMALLLLLATNNAIVGIGPHARPENNGRLQKALAVRESTRPGDVIVVAGTGDYADAEVYLPYFARREVLAVNTYLTGAPSLSVGLEQLRVEMDRTLEAGRRLFIHEELLSSEGPYAALRARHGMTRARFIAFLHRHYRLERPVRWRRAGARASGSAAGSGSTTGVTAVCAIRR